MEFKVGDVVKLKSGGPKMTVIDVIDGAVIPLQPVACVWFFGEVHERAFTHSFPHEALLAVKDE